MHILGNKNKNKEVKVKSVEKLVMGPTDVLFVTISGEDHDPIMLRYLHEELRELLQHERFMIITDAIKLQVLGGEAIKKAKDAMKMMKAKEDDPGI